MADIKKINVAPVFNIPLALAGRGTRLASDHFEKLGVANKVSSLKQHPVAVKVINRIHTSHEMLWAALGLVLLLHGAQFKNLFLCFQIITTFCLVRLKDSVCGIHSDVMTVHEKMNADAPAPSNADAKAEAKPDNKHASKRNSKKDDQKGADPADVKLQQEQDAATTKKYLKALDTDKVARAAFDVFTSFMACHMVMRSKGMQTIVVTHALVKAAKPQIESLFEFAGHEDMLAWMDFFVSFVLYFGFGFVAVTMAPVALALNLAVVGAQLVSDHGLKVAEGMGRLVSAEAFAASVKGFGLFGALAAFGTMWQLWSLMADSGMGWCFSILYLPGVTAELLISHL